MHWQNVPLLREIKSALSFNEGSTGFDTDVNAGALAEFVLGKAFSLVLSLLFFKKIIPYLSFKQHEATTMLRIA